MPSQYTTIHKIDAGLLSDDKYDVMMAMIGDEHPNFAHIQKQTPIFKGKEVMPIKHTKEQEAQIALKRLKKNKKKQAKKNKKNKKTKTKTNEKTSKEYLEKLRVYEKNQCEKIAKLRHFLEDEPKNRRRRVKTMFISS